MSDKAMSELIAELADIAWERGDKKLSGELFNISRRVREKELVTGK